MTLILLTVGNSCNYVSIGVKMRVSSNQIYRYYVRFEIPSYSNANGTAQPDCLDDKVSAWGDIHYGYMVSDNRSLSTTHLGMMVHQHSSCRLEDIVI